jgi:hypothetical protein
MGGHLKVLAQSTMHLGKPFVVHLHSFPLMDVKLLVIRVVHHLFASRCKCVLIVPIELRGIILFFSFSFFLFSIHCIILRTILRMQPLGYGAIYTLFV